MYSRFPFSMENLPRQTGFACFSLRFGAIVAALFTILYSILRLAHCLATYGDLPEATVRNIPQLLEYSALVMATIVNCVTFVFSAYLLLGALREQVHMVKPWVFWTSLELTMTLLLFVFFSTINMINHSSDNSVLVYIAQFLIILVRFYMLVVVASYCKQLEDSHSEVEKLKRMTVQDSWYSGANE